MVVIASNCLTQLGADEQPQEHHGWDPAILNHGITSYSCKIETEHGIHQLLSWPCVGNACTCVQHMRLSLVATPVLELVPDARLQSVLCTSLRTMTSVQSDPSILVVLVNLALVICAGQPQPHYSLDGDTHHTT